MRPVFHKFLTTLLNGTAATRRHGRSARRNSRDRRLKLEFLEDRLALSGSPVLVTSSADSGPGTLRDVISNAVSGETIEFAHSVHAITLTSGELAITKNLDIEGPGANKLTISGNNASRVFDISNSATVTIAGLTITGGQSSGQLPESMVGEYEYSTTPPLYSGAGGGGGILNQFGASLTLKNDTLSGNQAVGAVGFTVLGGGLLNLGTACVTACTFTNNGSVGGGALDNIGGSAGGAIDNFAGPNGGAVLTVSDSTFSNNTASAAGNGYYFGLGAAVESDAGLNGFTPGLAHGSSAAFTNCTFVNNLATGGPDAIGEGGAMVNEGIGATMSLTACTVSGNHAVGGGGGGSPTFATGDSEGIAGGLWNGGGSVMTIQGCAITNNVAQAGDNAALSDGDPYASGAFGGGIQNNANAVLNISNSVVTGNLAKGGNMTSQPGPGGDAAGGGIDNSAAYDLNQFYNPTYTFPLATVNMTDCLVANNSAIAGHGGPGVNTNLVAAQAGFAFGGGVDTSHNGTISNITGSTITGNRAVGGAGGGGNEGGGGYGGGLAVGYGVLIAQPEGSQLTLSNSLVAGNQAVGGAGGGGGDGLGGGLFVNSTASATVEASAIILNSALGGCGAGGQGIGGGVYNEGSFTPDRLTAIDFNFASYSNNNLFG